MNHTGTKTIETTRLILRRHEMSDAEDMFKNWVTDPEAARFWSWEPHRDISETKSLLGEWIEAYKDIRTYHWIITHKTDRQAIGYIYLNDLDDEEQSACVHYLLSRKCWNGGLMTEACRAVLGFAFGVVHMDTMRTSHHADNPASGRVMQKCGMRCTGTEYKTFSYCERITGDYYNYELTKEEWFREVADN